MHHRVQPDDRVRRHSLRAGGNPLVVALMLIGTGGAAVRAQSDASPAEPPDDPSAVAVQLDGPREATGSATRSDQADATAHAPSAEVTEVAGDVDWALPGVSPLVDDGWTEVKVADRLAGGTQLRTGLRSHVNLRFGDSTHVSIRSATHASIDDFFRSAGTETIRIGLAYGTVRGGTRETRVRSDLTVNSTVVTLAKRGTDGWQMWVEPMSGRYQVSLARQGLVEAIQRLHGGRHRSRLVRPGEYANQDNIADMWINQAVFDRNVSFYDTNTTTQADASFAAMNTRGFSVFAPGAGATVVDMAGRRNGEFFLAQAGLDRSAAGMVVLRPEPLSRREGNFGTPSTFRILAASATVRKRSADRGYVRRIH